MSLLSSGGSIQARTRPISDALDSAAGSSGVELMRVDDVFSSSPGQLEVDGALCLRHVP